MRSITMSLALGLAVLAVRPAVADDIHDALGQAESAYSSGDYGRAKRAADLASTLLGQLFAEQLAKVLPAALDGWTVEDSTSAGDVIFGGGVETQRTYVNAQDQRVLVQLVADSPMVAQMAGLFANPAMAASLGKLVRIKDQQGVVTDQGDYQMVVDNRFMVTVSGDAPTEAKKAYAEAIDLSSLK